MRNVMVMGFLAINFRKSYGHCIPSYPNVYPMKSTYYCHHLPSIFNGHATGTDLLEVPIIYKA